MISILVRRELGILRYIIINVESLNLDIAALEMVDEAYLDKEEWIKKSIRTTAKVR